MTKRVRQTLLALGRRTKPAWVKDRMHERPDWNCPTPEKEAAFKAFVFQELDRREAFETDALAATVQRDEVVARFMDLVNSGWAPPQPSPQRAGRPKADPIRRRFIPSEDAARTVTTIREIFEDYWDKWNRGRPSAVELAAEYVQVKVGEVETRLKRSKGRRPE